MPTLMARAVERASAVHREGVPDGTGGAQLVVPCGDARAFYGWPDFLPLIRKPNVDERKRFVAHFEPLYPKLWKEASDQVAKMSRIAPSGTNMEVRW